MKVIATKRGYYKVIREEGEVFDYAPGDDLKKDDKLPSWMVPVPTEGKAKLKGKADKADA